MSLAELHDELRSVARDALGGALDRRAAADLGWYGLDAPESAGGAGATFAELAVVLEEAGRAAAALPLLGTAVLGVGALAAAGAGDLLAGVVAGETGVAVAVRDDRRFVVDAPDADVLLVATPAELQQVRARVEPQPVLDATRSLGALTEIEVERSWPWPDGAFDRLLDRASLAIAVDSLGVAAALLDRTVDYVTQRHQFGQPIGSFQAVKHQCADMLVALTVGRALVADAVATLDRLDVDRAAAHVTQAAVDVAGTSLQLHGGIGYTWESGLHVHFKRALLNRDLFAPPRAHRRRIAATL